MNSEEVFPPIFQAKGDDISMNLISSREFNLQFHHFILDTIILKINLKVLQTFTCQSFESKSNTENEIQSNLLKLRFIN